MRWSGWRSELKLFGAEALRQLGFPKMIVRRVLGLTALEMHVLTEREAMTTILWKKVIRYYQKCLRCGALDDLQVDHVRAVARFGKTEWRNLQVLCGKCNRWKGVREIDFRGK